MWNTEVKSKIDKMIKDKAFNNNYAVFDCDNTIIMNDVQFATTHYMLKFKKFLITPDELEKFMKENFKDDKEVVENFLEKFKVAYNSDINSINYLKFLALIRHLIEYIYFKYDHIDLSDFFLSKFTEKEIKELVRSAITYHESLGYGYDNWIYEDDISTHVTGIAIADEMKELIKNLYENGIDVYVVSASVNLLVEEMLEPIKPYIKHIYGKQLIFKDDICTGIRNDDLIFPVGKGKSDLIDKLIKPLYQKDPIFVAGDNAGDYNMLTEYDNDISLIIDRKRNNKIQELINSTEEKYLVQRVDATQGIFIEENESIML